MTRATKRPKVGADDFIHATGATAADFNGLPEAEIPPPPAREPVHPSYVVQDGCLCRRRRTKETTVIEPLANFAATIVEEVTVDDGAEEAKQFVVEAHLAGAPAPVTARVSAEKFGELGWVTRQCGARFIVTAGLGARDHLRAAIQTLSPAVRSRHVYAHTGWREIGGRAGFLSATGAIGLDHVEVALPPALHRYALPRDPIGVREAMQWSLRFLTLGPRTVTVPLLAAIYRAPTAHLLPVDFTLFLQGPSGNLKTTLTALALNHFGPTFDRLQPPAHWASTANQLERLAFAAKDVVLLIDDFAPGATDARELQAKAERVLRAQGNLTGRGRLRPDLTERPAFPPRGLIVVTGEQAPSGASLLARTLIVELDRARVNLTALTTAQAQARPVLAHAMAGYVAALAPQLDAQRPTLEAMFVGARAKVHGADAHLRVPEILAHLWVGLSLAVQFALDVRACDQAEADDLIAEGWIALLEAGAAQGRLVRDEQPAHRFLRVLQTLFVQCRAELLPPTVAPAPPEKGERALEPLGWADATCWYLLPEAAHAAVAKFCRDAGTPFVAREDRIRADLLKAGLSEASPGRTTTTARLGGQVHRVLKLRREAITRLLASAPPTASTPSPDVTDVTAVTSAGTET